MRAISKHTHMQRAIARGTQPAMLPLHISLHPQITQPNALIAKQASPGA